jgi:hypothetical protein
MSSDQKNFSDINDKIRRLEDRIEEREEWFDRAKKEYFEEKKCRLFEINGSESHRNRVDHLRDRWLDRAEGYEKEINGYRTQIRQLKGLE